MGITLNFLSFSLRDSLHQNIKILSSWRMTANKRMKILLMLRIAHHALAAAEWMIKLWKGWHLRRLRCNEQGCKWGKMRKYTMAKTTKIIWQHQCHENNTIFFYRSRILHNWVQYDFRLACGRVGHYCQFNVKRKFLFLFNSNKMLFIFWTN